jgi:hypothetical protein
LLLGSSACNRRRAAFDRARPAALPVLGSGTVSTTLDGAKEFNIADWQNDTGRHRLHYRSQYLINS